MSECEVTEQGVGLKDKSLVRLVLSPVAQLVEPSANNKNYVFETQEETDGINSYLRDIGPHSIWVAENNTRSSWLCRHHVKRSALFSATRTR